LLEIEATFTVLQNIRKRNIKKTNLQILLKATKTIICVWIQQLK